MDVRLKKFLSIFILSIGILSYFPNCIYASLSNNAQTLDFVVHHTLQHNPNVLRSQANLEAARAALKQALGDFLPDVDVRFATGRARTKKSYEHNRVYELDREERGLYFNQPIFAGWGTYNAVKQRKLEIKTAQFKEAYTKEVLALQAIKVYFDLLRIEQLRSLALQNVKIHEQTLKKVTMRYKGGGGYKTDVDLAKGRLAKSRSLLESVDVAYQNMQATFLKIVGFSPKRLQLPKIPEVPLNFIEAENIALQSHPVLLAAQTTTHSTGKAVSVAKSRLFPTVDIEIVALDNDDVFGIEGNAKDVRGMVVAYYNVFNGGSDLALIRRAEQGHIAAVHDYDRAYREVVEDVTQAWDNLLSDREQLKELRAHVISSREVLEGYKEQFEIGRRSLLDVLDMESELFSAKMALVNGEFAVKVDHYDLLASMGKLTAQF